MGPWSQREERDDVQNQIDRFSITRRSGDAMNSIWREMKLFKNRFYISYSDSKKLHKSEKPRWLEIARHVLLYVLWRSRMQECIIPTPLGNLRLSRLFLLTMQALQPYWVTATLELADSRQPTEFPPWRVSTMARQVSPQWRVSPRTIYHFAGFEANLLKRRYTIRPPWRNVLPSTLSKPRIRKKFVAKLEDFSREFFSYPGLWERWW